MRVLVEILFYVDCSPNACRHCFLDSIFFQMCVYVMFFYSYFICFVPVIVEFYCVYVHILSSSPNVCMFVWWTYMGTYCVVVILLQTKTLFDDIS